MADRMSGGCACGKVRFEAEVDSDDAYLCHCRMCQRATGSVSIAFKNLPPEVVHRVVDKFVMQLEGQLADRTVIIELTDDARAWLARKGYSHEYGARPLARIIQEHVKKPLAEELLFGRLAKGGTVRVVVRDDCRPDEEDTATPHVANDDRATDREGFRHGA